MFQGAFLIQNSFKRKEKTMSEETTEKKFDRTTARPLIGPVSPETAYVQPDYPYGRRLRCKRRVWVETHPRHGMRFVTQTTNPKRAGEVWNKPHASTYSDLIALWVDDKGYVATDQLVNIGFYDLATLKAWGERNKALIEADDYVANKHKNAVLAREAYEAKKANGEVKVKVTTFEFGKGVTNEETITIPRHPADQAA
jgi:hypothetical protein